LIGPKPILGALPAKDRLRFVLLGDWGSGDGSERGIVDQMISAHRQSRLDFAIGAGDNIYPNGSGRHFESKFERPYAAFIKDKVSFYTVLGNHDVKEGRADQCSYPLFNMSGRCYYTIKKGDGLAEFFMIDSTNVDLEQAAWLEEALRSSTGRWKIAVFHHPIYSSGKLHGSDMALRKRLEPLLTGYGVNLAFSGHDHIYERTKPQNGVQYFVSGAGGKVRKNGVNLGTTFRDASYDQHNHFMLIELDDKQVGFKAISETGQTVDSGLIYLR
jgi:3',5'-cyclic AMP phosphodiesterase CpdA